MRRVIASLILASLTLAAHPARAADEWKQWYLDAKDKDLPRKRYDEALRNLNRSLAAKPTSSLGERDYSLEFFNYFPHYQLGRAYVGLQRRDDAIASFREELRQGLIQKVSSDYDDLNKLLKEAEDRQNQDTIRALRREFERLLDSAADLESRDRIDDAMSRAQEAMARARNLDPSAQSRVTAVIEGLRQKQTAKETEARLQREREQLQRALVEAQRLLNAGQHRDALVRFDAILKTDPANIQASNGRIEALNRLLTTTTAENRRKDLSEGRRLLEAGAIDEAIPLLTEAATDPTLTEALTLLRHAQDLSAQRKARQESERRIADLRREVSRHLQKNNYTEASLRLNLILGLLPGDPEATRQLADIDERMARSTLDLVLGDRLLPGLDFVAPKVRTSETYEDSITVSGVATDDRALAEITITSGGTLTHREDLTKAAEARTHTFDESVPITKGMNRIVVSVKDRKGRSFSAVFEVFRKPTLVESPYFYPLVALCAVSLVGTGAGVYAARRRRALRNRFNPYIAGAPVLSNAMFFGRKKLLSRVLNMIHANSLMITGDRRIGKTSFMHHLKMALAEDEGTEFKFFPVSVDLQGVPENTFFHTMMSEIVDALGLSAETLSEMRFRAEIDDYDDRDFSRDLQRVITDLKGRTQKKVKLALLLDEVDELNEYSERVNQRLRSVFMKTFSENLVAVMSGVGIRRSWKSEGSPWYNFFDEFELSGLSRDEAEELIRTPVQGVFRFEDEAVEKILNLSDLKPYLIQKFCIHAVNHMIEEGRSTIAVRDVVAVEALVLSDESATPRTAAEAQSEQPTY